MILAETVVGPRLNTVYVTFEHAVDHVDEESDDLFTTESSHVT